MARADAATVARLLREFGHYSALRGGNPYRAKAYARAADSLAALGIPLDTIVREGRLKEIPGIGDAIADIVGRMHATGSHPKLEAMRKEIPAGVLEMLAVPGLRPDKIIKLHRDLGISSLAELEAAAKADRLKPVKGLGAALQSKILRNLAISREQEGRRHIHRAAALIESAIARFHHAQPDLKRIEPAGEYRRGCELVRELTLVAETLDPRPKPEIVKAGELAVHLTDHKHFGVASLFATGSSRHLDQLRAHAAKRGLSLTEAGVRRGSRLVASGSEQTIYRALGLPFIPPELREGRDEIARALKGDLPVLVADKDLRGILHAHTDLSDGVDTLDAMAEATRARGYEYFGVADHSKSAHYAGGLSVEEIDAQHQAVDLLNRRYPPSFQILKGIESDILADGSLDYPDEVLTRFDFVVASVHSRFRVDKQTQTSRIIRAVSNPHTTILGHMTGRQLLRRPGYEIDFEEVLKACAEHNVAIEINANPWRLDLDWRWHERALELGCMMSINPDAHSTDELDLTHWGVVMARKGGVPADRVLNALPLQKLKAHLRHRHRRAFAA